MWTLKHRFAAAATKPKAGLLSQRCRQFADNNRCRSFVIIKRPFRATSVVQQTTNQHRYSSKANHQRHPSLLTNGGTIEGVWIFFRHGDRAPSRPLSPAHMIGAEAEFWIQRMPKPDSMAAFEAFSQFYPPDIHPSNDGQFLDVRRAPFGFLTHTGLEQTRENGVRLFNRYNNHGHHLPDRQNYDTAKDFLDAWDVKVYSTNYLRTIMSVQSFLDGLFATKCYKSLVERMKNNNHPHLRHTVADMRIPNHYSVPKPFSKEALIRVQVRGRDQDTLNAFDRNPDLMADLVSEVISSPEFQERDGAAAPLAARLANILPGLARKKKNTHGFNAAPSGINWIEATDHFVCRRAHNVPFSRFSDFEHDDRIEQTLEGLSHQTTAHLAWRFRQWYKSPRLLAAIAAPPLREIAEQLMVAPALAETEKRPFTIYSCHDVTILALLYGMGAEFLAGDTKGGWRFWPAYASTLVFELVRIDDDSSCTDWEHSHVMRILLNGRPILSVDLHNNYWQGPGTYVGHGPMNMLLAHDFDNIVTKLERAGGYDHPLSAEDYSKKRDMSNWTPV